MGRVVLRDEMVAWEKMAADVGRAVSEKTVLVTIGDHVRIVAFEEGREDLIQQLKLKFTSQASSSLYNA